LDEVQWGSFFQVSDLLDIAFIALLIYAIIVWFKKTRAVFILIGIAIAGAIYLFASQFNLILTTQIFQSVFAVTLIAAIVIFQQEIRYFFEQIAVWSLHPKFGQKKANQLQSREVNILAKTLFDFAEKHIGALIVIRGRSMIEGVVDGGVALDAKLSEHILKSIFDPHSIGHDGALIIEGKKLKTLCAHLPLSKDTEQLKYSGTRHAAALGLAEVTDALCLIVSEERGAVSVAQKGKINSVENSSELMKILDEFYTAHNPLPRKNAWRDFFKKNYREKALALSVATLLWFVQVYSTAVVYKTLEVPIEIFNTSKNLTVAEMSAKKIKLTFTAPRRAFYSLWQSDIHASLNISHLKKGKRSIELSEAHLSFPEGLVLRGLFPTELNLTIESAKKK